MEPQTIEIRPEYKPHEVLALCLHFYNQGYYIKQVDNWYGSPVTFKFVGINNILNEQNLSFTTEPYETTGGRFEYKFTNDKGDYKHTPKTSIIFRYDSIKTIFNYKYREKKWSDYEIGETTVSSTTTKIYDFTEDLEKKNFLEYQNKMARNLKFYEENALFITEPLKQSSQRDCPSFTLDYINSYKSYIDSVKEYQTRDSANRFETLQQILTCFNDDMIDTKTYNFKMLRFRRNSYSSMLITINKSFRLNVYINNLRKDIESGNYSMVDPAFNLILPMFEQTGGIKELQNVILHNRILTE